MWQTEQREYQKSWSYATLLLTYNTLYFLFWAIFCPLPPPPPPPRNNPKNQNLQKMKKTPGDIIILHMCTKCESWNTEWDFNTDEREEILAPNNTVYKLQAKLALKDTAKEIPKFTERDNFYTNIFYLFNNSGKFKKETKNAAAALNISHYTSCKILGRRFLNHRCRGFKNLINNWPALITSFQNVLANDCVSSMDIRAKTKAILIKLKSYLFLCKVAVYLDILEAVPHKKINCA